MKQKIRGTMQRQISGSVANPIINRYKTLTPAIISNAVSFIKTENPPGTTYEPMTSAIHFHFGLSLGPFYDMEFGFPINLDNLDDEYFSKFMNAMRFVVDKSKEYSASELCKYSYNSLYAMSSCTLCRRRNGPVPTEYYNGTSCH